MSLSFVTKAIQTTAADGTFEEQAVDNGDDENQGATRGGTGVGLFDQLRQNKDEEEAARLEFQRSIMRGTLSLDEDGAAHLQELQRQKEAESAARVRDTETQLASFRAARAERFDRPTTIVNQQDSSILDSTATLPKIVDATKLPFVPTIKIKKRRRQEHDNNDATVTETLEIKSSSTGTKVDVLPAPDDDKKSVEHSSKVVNTCDKNMDGTLSSLLAGYSSDEED